MEAHELFPGAVVFDNADGRIVVVNSVNCVDSGKRYTVNIDGGRRYISPLSRLSPPPLSPEVLAGLGMDDRNMFGGNKIQVFLTTPPSFWFIGIGFIERIHAHQLQRLAWDLCGVKLEWDESRYEKAKGEGK